MSHPLFVAAILATSFAPQQPPPPRTSVVAVSVGDSTQDASRAIAFALADNKGGCRLLTVAHLNEKARDRALTMRDRNYPEVGFRVDVDLEEKSTDILVSESLRSSYFTGCPGLPAPESADYAISGLLDLVVATSSGEQERVLAHATRISAAYLEVRPVHPEQRFRSGMSGAPLVINGTPVALLQSVSEEGRLAVARRLDNLPGSALSLLSRSASWGAAVPAARQPYDESQLPDTIRTLVREARRTRERVESVAQAARLTRDRAAETRRKAELVGGFNSARDGYANLRFDDGARYSGEVLVEGSTLRRFGYGVFEASGPDSGNVYYCEHGRNGLCQRYGVWDFGRNDNAGFLVQWEGAFDSKGNVGGDGVATLRNSDKIYQRRDRDANGALVARPGVWALGDGRRFEGVLASIFVEGVLWDKDGQVICVGFWKADKPSGSTPDAVRTQAAGLPGCRKE